MRMVQLRPILGNIIFGLPKLCKAQQLTQRLLRGPRLVEIELHGRRFLCVTSQRYYWFGEPYEPGVRRLLKQFIRPGSVFYDVGAHWRYWEVSLFSECRTIVALEPSPFNYGKLVQNILINGIPNVIALNVAAARTPAKLRFEEYGSMSRVSDSGSLVIDGVPIDQIAANPQCGAPDLVKIDLEGFASEVLGGMTEVVQRNRPTLILEIHNADEEHGVRELKRSGHVERERVGAVYPYHVVFSGR